MVIALIVGLFGSLWSRLLEEQPVVYIVSGILMLVPGGLGVKGATALFDRNDVSVLNFFAAVLQTAVSIAVGLLVAKFIFPSKRAPKVSLSTILTSGVIQSVDSSRSKHVLAPAGGGGAGAARMADDDVDDDDGAGKSAGLRTSKKSEGGGAPAGTDGANANANVSAGAGAGAGAGYGASGQAGGPGSYQRRGSVSRHSADPDAAALHASRGAASPNPANTRRSLGAGGALSAEAVREDDAENGHSDEDGADVDEDDDMEDMDDGLDEVASPPGARAAAAAAAASAAAGSASPRATRKGGVKAGAGAGGRAAKQHQAVNRVRSSASYSNSPHHPSGASILARQGPSPRAGAGGFAALPAYRTAPGVRDPALAEGVLALPSTTVSAATGASRSAGRPRSGTNAGTNPGTLGSPSLVARPVAAQPQQGAGFTREARTISAVSAISDEGSPQLRSPGGRLLPGGAAGAGTGTGSPYMRAKAGAAPGLATSPSLVPSQRPSSRGSPPLAPAASAQRRTSSGTVRPDEILALPPSSSPLLLLLCHAWAAPRPATPARAPHPPSSTPAATSARGGRAVWDLGGSPRQGPRRGAQPVC